MATFTVDKEVHETDYEPATTNELNSYDIDSTADVTSQESVEDNAEYVPGSFEGPEKTMEVWFRPNCGHIDGLRALSRDQLDHLCTKAKCSIVSKVSSSYMDAYVLSESSLFIYKYKYIMKTCGTTTLLRCLDSLLLFADKLGLELMWVGYSRKNLNNPHKQHWPHSSFDDEIRFLGSHKKLEERLHGSGYILGPVTGDHWFVYCADHSELPLSLCADSRDVTMNLMMFDMAPAMADIFYRCNTETARDMTIKSGIIDLCPGAIIDDCAFTPCGYSMNAILHETYATIHITPEEQCSYASFETNAFLPTYLPIVRNVLSVFKPKRFVLTLFGDESALKHTVLPTDSRCIMTGGNGSYVRTSQSSAKVEGDLCCLMACFATETPNGTMNLLRKIRSTSFVA